MHRKIYQELQKWRASKKHIPLLLRGARQVGKTYLVEQLGNNEFSNFININFELQPDFKDCFNDLDPNKIITQISAITRQSVIQGETLLFLDEIQLCPQAIQSLRYFKEKMPGLHVISAGSLLEFTINEESFQMPVGRVQSLYIKPASFYEYLSARGYDDILEIIKLSTIIDPPPLSIHNKLVELLREYFVIGGMPEVISDYLDNQDLNQVQARQTSIIDIYRSDFAKYASKVKYKYIQKLFDVAPNVIGQRIRYSAIDPHIRSEEIKLAIEYLKTAGVIHQVFHTSAAGLPLNSIINPKKYKLLYLDVGLAKASSMLDPSLMLRDDLMLINKGALAEQFVGQELLAYLPEYLAGNYTIGSEKKLVVWLK